MQWEDTTLDVGEDAGSVTLTVVFTTTLNAPPAADFTFDVTMTFADVSTTEDDDYTTPPFLTTFLASEFSQTDVNGQQRYRATRDFTIAIIDDTVDESDESLRVTINYLTPGLSHLQGGPQTATITIQDDEHVPVAIGWDRADVTVDEDDGSLTLHAWAVTTVDKRPEDGFSFDADVSTSSGSASEPDDYTRVDETLTFARNDFSRATVNGQRRYRAIKQIVVDVQDDTTDEVEEDFEVTFEYASPGLLHLQGGAAVANVKITDNDDVSITIGWEQTDVSISEDAGSATLDAQATTTEDVAPQSDVSFTVNVSTRPGSAKQDSAYTSLTVNATFTYSDFSPTSVNGDLRYRAEKQFTIAILDDIYDEPDEDFTVTVAYASPRPPYLQGGSATATVTITNDDEGGPKRIRPPPPITGGGGFGPAPVAPKFNDGFRTTRDLPQNARPGDAVGDPVSATHPDDLEITYSVTGADAASFTVDEETGQVRAKEGVEPHAGEHLHGQPDGYRQRRGRRHHHRRHQRHRSDSSPLRPGPQRHYRTG